MKPVYYFLLFLAVVAVSCSKNTAGPQSGNNNSGNNNNDDTTVDPVDPVDSLQKIKDKYLNDTTSLFIFFDGRGEHVADSAYFDVRKDPYYPVVDHFVVYLHTDHHRDGSYSWEPCNDGCLEMEDYRTTENIGTRHSVQSWSSRCKSMSNRGVANGFSLVVRELTADHISGYFWYYDTWGSFNHVPIVQ